MKPGTRVEMTEEARRLFPKAPFTATVIEYKPHHQWKLSQNIRIVRDGRKTKEVWPIKWWKECVPVSDVVEETIRAFAMSNWERFPPRQRT